MASSTKTTSGQAPKRPYPELTKVKDVEPATFTRFYVIHSEDEQRPVGKMSPFVVAKVLENLIGYNYKAKKMHSSDLLVEVNTKDQSMALQKLSRIVDVQVTAAPHRTLNTIRGVLSEDDLLHSSEEEILEGLRPSGVVAVKRIIFKRDGVETPSKHVILTFERHTLPAFVKAGYLHCRVRPYVPNPLRCFRCQRFGHGARSCRGKNICAKCGSTDHVADICESEVKCANCDGVHPAYSRACPIWKQEKEILSLRAKDNLSYPEAKKRYAFLAKGGFLEVVRRGLAPPSEPRPFQVPSGNREAVAQPPPTKKPEVAACPPPQRGGTGAPPTQRDRLSNDMPALITRSPPRRKERAPRPKPPEEPSTSKEQQAPSAAYTVSPEEERMDVSESPPIRLAPPDDSKLKKSSQKKPIPRVTPPKPPEGV